MKNLTLTLFLALICRFGFAQDATNLYITKIDSVQNLLNKKPKDDWLKIVTTAKARFKIRAAVKEEKGKNAFQCQSCTIAAYQ